MNTHSTLPWNIDLNVAASILLTAALLTCTVISMVQIVELAFPDWQGDYLVWLGFFTAVESMISYRTKGRRSFPDLDWLLYRGSEALMLLLAVKICAYLPFDLDLLVSELSLGARDFGRSFLSGEFWLGASLIFGVWFIASRIAIDLYTLEVDENLLKFEAEGGIAEYRPAARQRLVNMILWIGIWMIILTAALRLEKFTSWASLPPLRAGVYNLLAYFFLALVLLSLTQYSLLRARWLTDRLSVRPEIPTLWVVYSLVFIFFITFLVAMLPTGYSIGFLGALNFLARLAISAVMIIVFVLSLPVMIILNLMMRLFGAPIAPQENPIPPVESFLPTVHPAGPAPWLELLKSLLFWLVLTGAVGAAVFYYIRERRDLWQAVSRTPLYPLMLRLWRWLKSLWRAANHQVMVAVSSGLARLRARLERGGQPARWNYLNLRRLAPRQRVWFYYQAMLRRGGEAGLPRRPQETPYEYAGSLSGLLSSASPAETSPEKASTDPETPIALSDLTQHFVEARYSAHPVTPQDAEQAKDLWEHLRRVLRKPRSRPGD